MKEFKGTKSAANYIETVYGTKRFARTLVVDDAQSLMDLMQDFSDFNLKQSKAPELLEAMQEFCDTVTKPEFSTTDTYNKFKELIKQATEV